MEQLFLSTFSASAVLLVVAHRKVQQLPAILNGVDSKNSGNPSHSPIGKHFPNSKYENVKNKQIQISIFAPAGTKILDLFDSEHPYLESRKSLLREFTLKSDFILMATDVSAFLQCVVQDNQPNLSNLPNPYLSFQAALQFLKLN